MDEKVRSQVESAAFNILADLCTRSHKGTRAVTSASSFNTAFDRALKLVSPVAHNLRSIDSEEIADGANRETEFIKHHEGEKANSDEESRHDSLVEAAYYFLSATTLAKSMEELLACNETFVKGCFKSASTGSNATIRRSAMGVVAKLCRSRVENSAISPEKAGELFRQVLVDNKISQGNESQMNSIQIVAADGLLHILDELSSEQEQSTIEVVAKVYLSVVRQRSLSKSSQIPGDLRSAGELAFCLVRILVLGMRSENADNFFGSCAVAPLVGTIQWRYDSKTTLDADEIIYWDATTSHAMQILSLWFEQGKASGMEENMLGGWQCDLKDHVWMVAGVGKAPRKSIDFGGALQIACRNGDASTRLAAARLWNWLTLNASEQ